MASEGKSARLSGTIENHQTATKCWMLWPQSAQIMSEELSLFSRICNVPPTSTLGNTLAPEMLQDCDNWMLYCSGQRQRFMELEQRLLPSESAE